MDFVAHQCSKALVDELVACQRAFSFKLGSHNEGLKVRIVVTNDVDNCVGQSGYYQLSDF